MTRIHLFKGLESNTCPLVKVLAVGYSDASRIVTIDDLHLTRES